MSYDLDARQEHIPTFLHPEGIPEDPEPYVTDWGLILPGILSSTEELIDLENYVESASPEEMAKRPLPKLRQLGRISLNPDTGCWELPIYGDGKDTYKTANRHTKVGQPRARYGCMTVKGAGNKPTDKLAHRTMYAIMRGGIPSGNFIDHLCRNQRCCYHRHLEAVTPQENTQRRYEAGTLSLGNLY